MSKQYLKGYSDGVTKGMIYAYSQFYKDMKDVYDFRIKDLGEIKK